MERTNVEALRGIKKGQPSYARSERISWCFYDWANSAFATTVLAVFLSPYLTTVSKAAADANGFVYPLGIPVSADSFAPFAIAFSAFLQFICLPVLGAIADYSQSKKQMLALFAFLGSLATMGLYFLQGTNYLLGGGLLVLANLSFGASIIIYYAFLPEISGPDQRNSVSSYGWALGYLGGGLLLAMNLALVSQAGALGLSLGHAVRISLASAGAWWALFTIIPLMGLKNRQPAKSLPPGKGYLATGFGQLRHTLGKASHYPQTLLFLLAYLLYNDGIQTVLVMTAQFAQEEIGISISTLPAFFLMTQFVGFFGSILFNHLAASFGTKRAIIVSLLVWALALVYAGAMLQTATQFFALGAVIAIVLGGSQALSRSVYSLMIPRGQEAEYFSLYEVSERGTSWLGPLFVGMALQFTGSYRVGILVPIVFFLAGIALLARVDVRRAAVEAGNEAPAHG
ncbi:MAG: MFS transporter [Chloroflexi bacterium]|nr:MFS transporter [Chloroflexota bacterium]